MSKKPVRYPVGLPGFVYDSRTHNYHEVATGRTVARAKIMGLIQERIEHHQVNMVETARAHLDGRMTLQDWQRAMENHLKMLHIQQAVLARGGWAKMTPSDWGRVGQALREQYKYLGGFAQDIAAGAFKTGQPMSEGMTLARSALYANSGRGTYWKEATALSKTGGLTQERRLAIGDDGTCGPCTDLASKGWQPIGSLPPPGGPPCEGFTNCRCEKEFR